jgi:hypothetical protein
MAAVPVIAEVPFAARVIKEGERYLIQVPARPGLIYLLEVPDGAGGMTFAGVPGTAVYAQSDTVRWPLEVSGTVVGAEEEWNSAGASPPAAGGTVLLPLTIEVAESQGTHVRLRVDGASPWVAVAAATFPRVMFEGFADLPTATGVRSTALSTRVVTVPIGATEPGRAALTFEQQQEFDAILAGLPQLIAAATLPLGLPPALGNGSPSPLSSSRYFRVAMYQVDTNGNGYLDADELASGMNPFARPGESGYVDASNAGGNNGGNGGGIAPIWDSDDDFSPDFEEIAAGTSPMFKYSAPVVLTCQKFDRYAEFDSAGSWRELELGRIVGWKRAWDGVHEEMLLWSPPSLLAGTTPRTLAGFMSDFASGWENPNPESGKGLPPQSLLEEYFILPALIARQVKPVAGNPSVTSGYIRAIGDRYRLRGPLSSEDQHRQFLKVTWTQTTGFNENQFVEDAASSLMGQPLLEQEPTSVEVVTLTIPRGSLYSAPHDVVPQYSVPNGPANPEMPHSQVGEYLKVVRLLPIDLTAYKRGTIDAPGAAIPRPGGTEVYEVVTLENADYDETNWQPTSMSDGAQEDKQDGKTDAVSKDKDDDFVKLRFSCPLTNVAGSSEIVFDQAGQGERMQEGDIRFHNGNGERVQLSTLKTDDLKNPTGPLAPAFAGGLDLFVEIGDLGKTTSAQGSAESTTRKYADLIWKITIGGTTTEQKVRIYRGGFWRNDRTDNSGTIALYDGKGRKPDGSIDYGQIVKGPYQIKTGQDGFTDETTPNKGPTPMGWYGLFERADMRTWWDGSSRPQTNHHLNASSSFLGFVQQGSYCQWDQPGNHNIPGKGAYGYDNGSASDPYQGMPNSIHFKFELSPIGNFTTRTSLQIHPDGFCDGTAGCVGIQAYDDCTKVLYLVRHYFQTRLLVD